MQASATFKMEYSKLYETLSATLRDDQTTLLLYLLIHQNQGMKAFILSRTNIDTLVNDGDSPEPGLHPVPHQYRHTGE